ncbi:MAG TPA: phosphoserine phosphatase SerB [Thermohalobaculum sp.]|nr:phosphoserine phosphatase SerB [Thermohalobaculum sp.]
MAHVLVLTAAAGRGLADGEIAAVAGATGGGAPRRLGRAAAEIALDAPPDLAALRAAHRGIDLNAVPAQGRRKRLLIADMDSTIIPVECIDELADDAGVKAEVAAITARAMAGELDFAGALRARLALMQGLSETALARVFAERIRLNPGAATLVRTMAAHGAHTALVSGGFSFFTERVAAAAGFAEHRANRLIFKDGRLAGVAEPILGREAKLAALGEITARLGITPAAAIAVGDGANDLAMIEAAGLGVAYRAQPALEARADALIRHADLTALLHLQGYAESEFRHD